MENQNLNKSVQDFLADNEKEIQKEKPKTSENIEVISNKTGLIEVKQIQKKIITEDGRQLLI